MQKSSCSDTCAAFLPLCTSEAVPCLALAPSLRLDRLSLCHAIFTSLPPDCLLTSSVWGGGDVFLFSMMGKAARVKKARQRGQKIAL